MKHLSKLCFLVVFALFAGHAFAQNRVITGKVTDKKDGSPLVGVSVVAVPSSGMGTVTNPDGQFKVTVTAATQALSFSLIGYDKIEVKLGSKTAVNVQLEPSTKSLSEVVVVGYGSQRVKDATGSVASLGAKDFNKGVVSTPEQLLQGRIAGVQVTPASGEPGGSASVNIRGSSSIRAGNDPLYVIDGVPIDNSGTSNSGSTTNALGSTTARNPLEFINPNDIENISVLKDASASAIYGSRGANGVILITTKKGYKGQGIQFSENTTLGTTASRYKLMNPTEFLLAVNNTGANAQAVNAGSSTDWQDQIFRAAISQNANLSFGGGNEKSNYNVSFGYDNQNGVVKNSGMQRLSGRLAGSKKVWDDKLKLDANIFLSNVKNTYAPIGDNSGFQGSLIGAAIIANPTYPIKNADGSYYADGSSINPVELLNLIDDSDNINRIIASFGATLKLAKNLSYKISFSDDYQSAVRTSWYDPNLHNLNGNDVVRGIQVSQISGSGRGQIQNVDKTTIVTEHTLNYDVELPKNSKLNLLAGFSYQKSTINNWNQVAWNTSTSGVLVKDISKFKNTLPIFGDTTKSELQSFFGRVNYSFQDKYLITATLRTDGSSRFGANNKYATFPALAFRWKIMNESFAPKGIFDDLSVRLGYGQTGNQEIPPYASLAITQNNLDGSKTVITNANPNLKWETTTQTNGGIDFAFAHNRITGSVDYFNKKTKDLLFLQDYAQPAANSHRWVNLPGDVLNKGVEIGINVAAIKHKSFTWDISTNLSFISNKVENFGNANVNTGAINGQGLSGAYGQTTIRYIPLNCQYLPGLITMALVTIQTVLMLPPCWVVHCQPLAVV